ncbi:MAG: hypothetical protein JNM18_16685 [Planctomycetaceae bacterium]|nr:hypothetical protein [Planctomycetaceae bacterium]
MNHANRFKLLGTYRTPRFKLGQVVMDELRGEVRITAVTDAKITWPIGRRVGTTLRPGAILYGDILAAVRRESIQAVARAFGVSPWQVSRWRYLLRIAGQQTEGTRRLRQANAKLPWFRRAQRLAWAKARDPGRRAKIAAAKLGKPRPAAVVEKITRAKIGTTHTAESRAKMSKAHRRRGTRPPWLNPPWTKADDKLLRTLPAAEVAKRTGRTLTAVYSRRGVLGLPDGRRREK